MGWAGEEKEGFRLRIKEKGFVPRGKEEGKMFYLFHGIWSLDLNLDSTELKF